MAVDILYIGNYRHPWCTEVHIARDLESLGHRVDRFQEPDRPHEAIHEAIWRRGLNADLVLWTRTWQHLAGQRTTDLWRAFEAVGVKTASYHLDLYRGLHREESLQTDPFWTTGWVFTPDGNDESQRYFKSLGINHVWSPPAIVSDEIGRGTYRDRYASAVAFVGTPSPPYHPEWPWRRDLLDYLRNTWKARLWGGHFTGEPLRGQDLADCYASTSVVVGDSISLPGNEWYISDRYFETLGRGGFLLAPRVEPVLHYLGFVDGHNIALYDVGDLQTLGYQIEQWLADPEAREQVVQRAQDLIRERHTYAHRLRHALAVMGLK